MSAEGLICILIIAIGLIVFLILKCKLHAFIALSLAACFVGIATGMPLGKIADSIEKGVGGTLGFLALIIGFGSILGKMLESSGGAQRIAQTLLARLGKENATWAMMLVGFIAGIPVFVEVGFVLLVPLVFVVARDAGLSKVQIGVPLALSLMVVHCIVPPHPAAMAISATLGADVGKVIVFGLLAGLPCAIAGGPLFVKYCMRNPTADVYSTDDAPKTALDIDSLPTFGVTLLTILLPLLIMVGKTLLVLLLPPTSSLLPAIIFIGNPITALLISVFFAYYALGLARGCKMADLLSLTEKSFGPIAGILLIIGAGGAFNSILIDSGIGKSLASLLSTLAISPIFLAWLIAGILHFAVGSATVAMISAAGIVLPMAEMNPQLSREVLTIAIGAGAIGWTQVTDSLFWIVKEYLGLSLTETIRNYTVPTTIASVVGLCSAFILNAIL